MNEGINLDEYADLDSEWVILITHSTLCILSHTHDCECYVFMYIALGKIYRGMHGTYSGTLNRWYVLMAVIFQLLDVVAGHLRLSILLNNLLFGK